MPTDVCLAKQLGRSMCADDSHPDDFGNLIKLLPSSIILGSAESYVKLFS